MSFINRPRSYTALDLVNTDFPPRPFILEPWLRADETAVIWAATGVGKTLLSLSIALAVAGGGTVGDWSAPEACKVVYFDGEMHQGDLKQRIEDLLNCGAVQVPDREAALANLKIIARQAQDIGTDFYDLTNPEHREAIVELVQGKADLVFLDNLTTMSDGLRDENDAVQFKMLQALFMELKRIGVAAILVHHSNKSGNQMRGSSALEATFEISLGLKKVELAAPGRATFQTVFGKFRAKGDTRLEARTWTLEDKGWVISDAEPEEPADDPVLKALKSLECINQVEIAAKLNIHKATVSKRLAKAKVLGLLSETEAEDFFRKAERYRREEQSFSDPGLLDEPF